MLLPTQLIVEWLDFLGKTTMNDSPVYSFPTKNDEDALILINKMFVRLEGISSTGVSNKTLGGLGSALLILDDILTSQDTGKSRIQDLLTHEE